MPQSVASAAPRIAVLNLGSTSSKIALYAGHVEIFSENLPHAAAPDGGVLPLTQREAHILDFLNQNAAFNKKPLAAVMARGGLLKPLESGCYVVNDAMLDDLRSERYGSHASNRSAILGAALAERHGVTCYIADPVVVDELEPIARITGSPRVERQSVFHALNHKATARQFAKDAGKPYEALRLIVAHLGGGITVGAHAAGRVVDVNNGLLGEGPMSPNRPGGLAVLKVIELCETHDADYLRREMTQNSGLLGYLGSDDLRELRKRAQSGASEVALHLEAMAYQIAKEIGACAAVLCGRVDAILLTGGMAHDMHLVESIRERVGFIAPLHVYAGENEMQSLALACLRVLNGSEEAKHYEGSAQARGRTTPAAKERKDER